MLLQKYLSLFSDLCCTEPSHVIMQFIPPVPVTTHVKQHAKCSRRPRVLRLPCTCTISPTVKIRSDGDYAGWSEDFVELCRAQLDLLSSTVPQVTQVALFFRQEDARSGALEFVPLAVADNSRRVWIAHGSGATEVEMKGSNVLPGGLPAAYLLPKYPAVENDVMELPDGGLCVPVEYNSAVAGSVVLWRHGTPRPWSIGDIGRVRAVARSIAIAAALDGKVAARVKAADHAKELLNNAKSALGTATHQMRSAISALVTFGHVLLRKLEPGNPLRNLAKSIVVEARRLDYLLEPVDQVKAGLITESTGRPVENDGGAVKLLEREDIGNESNLNAGLMDALDNKDSDANDDLDEMFRNYESSFMVQDEEDEDDDDDLNEIEHDEPIEVRRKKQHAREAWERAIAKGNWMNLESDDWVFPNDDDVDTQGDERERELLWLADVATPVAETAAVLAEESGISFTSHIDNDAPATLASVDSVREAMYNIVHNALRYTRRGGHVGLVVVGTDVVVWDTGVGVCDEDKKSIWDKGIRGSNVIADGDGIGLHMARDAVRAAGGKAAMRSPIPDVIDPRSIDERDTPGSLFLLRFPRAKL